MKNLKNYRVLFIMTVLFVMSAINTLPVLAQEVPVNTNTAQPASPKPKVRTQRPAKKTNPRRRTIYRVVETGPRGETGATGPAGLSVTGQTGPVGPVGPAGHDGTVDPFWYILASLASIGAAIALVVAFTRDRWYPWFGWPVHVPAAVATAPRNRVDQHHHYHGLPASRSERGDLFIAHDGATVIVNYGDNSQVGQNINSPATPDDPNDGSEDGYLFGLILGSALRNRVNNSDDTAGQEERAATAAEPAAEAAPSAEETQTATDSTPPPAADSKLS